MYFSTIGLALVLLLCCRSVFLSFRQRNVVQVGVEMALSCWHSSSSCCFDCTTAIGVGPSTATTTHSLGAENCKRIVANFQLQTTRTVGAGPLLFLFVATSDLYAPPNQMARPTQSTTTA